MGVECAGLHEFLGEKVQAVSEWISRARALDPRLRSFRSGLALGRLAHIEGHEVVAVVGQPLGFEQQFPAIDCQHRERFLSVTEVRLVVDFDGRNRRGDGSVEKFFGT